MNLRYLLFPLLALCTNVATAAEWTADGARSRLGFVATYDKIPFEARFERFAAEVRFEASRPAEGRIEVTIQMPTVNSRSTDRDDGMRGPEWFHTAKYPTARFLSHRIAPGKDGTFQLDGDLTIKGITRAVAIPCRWSEQDRGARLQGEVAVKRTDFEIGTGEWKNDETIGFDVKIVFDLQLERK